jgi:hypothetical protein
MDYEQKIIEFLSQGQNLNFLFKLETQIPKVRDHLRKELNGAFFEMLPKDEYARASDKSNIYCKNRDFQDAKYYYLGICIRLDADEAFFGIIGPHGIDTANPHYEPLQSKLKTLGMQGHWRNWFVWKDFSTQDMNKVYLELKADNAKGIFENWLAEFNDFKEDIKPTLEALNQWIGSKQVS